MYSCSDVGIISINGDSDESDVCNRQCLQEGLLIMDFLSKSINSDLKVCCVPFHTIVLNDIGFKE